MCGELAHVRLRVAWCCVLVEDDDDDACAWQYDDDALRALAPT